VLARAQRHADRLEGAIAAGRRRSRAPSIAGLRATRATHHYDLFDPAVDRFTQFTQYRLDSRTWRLNEVVFADSVGSPVPAAAAAHLRDWTAQKGWCGR